MKVDYVFPEAYVEGVESHKYLCSLDDSYIVTTTIYKDLNCKKLYGLVPYEKTMEYIDLVEAYTKRSIAVLWSDKSKGGYTGYLLGEKTPLCLQEVRGSSIYVPRREGDTIRVGEYVAYTVSGKMEVRKVKSKCEGLIALIIDRPWEEPRRTLLVVVSEYREINAGENT